MVVQKGSNSIHTKTGAFFSMSNSDNNFDLQRRRVVQGAVLSTAALTVPGLAGAVCGADDHKLAHSQKSLDASPMLTSEDVAIELVETQRSLSGGQLARVTITNTSGRSIKLSHVSPGAISTQKGVYQFNATLQNNPLSIRSGGVYQFWLTPDDGTQALLSGRPKSLPRETTRSTTLEISVITKLESGRWTGTQRVQAHIS